MQTFNLSDAVGNYITNTNAKLTIKSVVNNKAVEFPAFLTDFSQTFDATWNTEDVFGRMDPIATYQGTKRTMSLGFDVPAGSLAAAQGNLARCAELVKMVYPIYNEKGILSKPPLVRIRFANLIRGRLLIDKEAVATDATEEKRFGNVVNPNQVIQQIRNASRLDKRPLLEAQFRNGNVYNRRRILPKSNFFVVLVQHSP